MGILILMLVVLAAFNASQAMTDGKWLRWSVTLYWFMVGMYWMFRAIVV